MIVNFAVERDREPPVIGQLRLHRPRGIDNAKAPRRHGRVRPRHQHGIADVAAMPDAVDQPRHRRFGLGPIDRNRNPAHAKSPHPNAHRAFRVSSP
jgi:hypothetical protein